VLIGVTGGIGAGKSKVAMLLGDLLNCPVFSADDVCRQLMEPGGAGFTAFIKGSGKNYLDTNGELNRARLRGDIFQDQNLKLELESILHPLVRNRLLEEKDMCGSAAMIIAEVPLLFESGWKDDFDVIVVVHASTEISLSRAVARDKDDVSGIEKIIDSQMAFENKRELADHVIYNSGDWQETVIQVESLAAVLQNQLKDTIGLQ